MPLLTQASSTFGYLTGVPPIPPKPIIFPKDSIVPFYGAVAPTDWSFYTNADGKYLTGTTNSSLAGTGTSTLTNGSSTITLGSSGAHTGTVSYVSCASTSTGSTLNSNVNNSAGAHSHYGTCNFATNQFNSTPSLVPQHTLCSLIRASKDVTEIPGNTVAFRNALTGTYGTKFGQPSGSNPHVYFRAGSGGTTNNINIGVNTSTAYSGTNEAGVHRHHTNVRQYYITGKLTNYYGIDSGTHYHSLTATMTQTLMNNTKLLDAWTSAASRVPARDVVVMYVGNPANLPENWFLCNGNNGTVNMDSYFVSTALTNNWGSIYMANAAVSNIIIGTIGSHTHVSTTNPAGAGQTLWHGPQAWAHTHTMSNTVVPMMQPQFFIYFIQYKG